MIAIIIRDEVALHYARRENDELHLLVQRYEQGGRKFLASLDSCRAMVDDHMLAKQREVEIVLATDVAAERRRHSGASAALLRTAMLRTP